MHNAAHVIIIVLSFVREDFENGDGRRAVRVWSQGVDRRWVENGRVLPPFVFPAGEILYGLGVDGGVGVDVRGTAWMG